MAAAARGALGFNCPGKLGCLIAGLLLTISPASGQVLEATRHNLSHDGNEPCVFCHTPSGNDTSSSRPAWSRNGSATAIFGTYDSLAGRPDQADPAASAPASSVACLACHDGTQAPEISARIVRSAAALTLSAPLIEGAGGAPPLGYFASVQGVNNSHPVGVRYRGATRKIGSGFGALRRATIGGQPQWWLDTEPLPNGLRDKTDIVFYTRRHNGRPQPFIECGSCHDPHSAANRVFLRIPNTGSRLCFVCHPK